ncbi:hypothetical protein AV521_00880 [Streptomyces sp. IMTB 2501]|uniref:hypothetical protein n=1 Tax=Streptomyces sp. IMTB 2501 TaxID=1776340 RepID=UPI00096EDDC0|nr:hypothetical protein [Streptomyces sp. IMTB 2501]OLZ74277.1 hypothetical protein AV521_00880 [Streptomyces sp. IMTB 2501]
MPSRDATDALAHLQKALLGAGIIVDAGIDPLGCFLWLNCLGIEQAEELALRIEAGTEARVVHL